MLLHGKDVSVLLKKEGLSFELLELVLMASGAHDLLFKVVESPAQWSAALTFVGAAGTGRQI